jgi:hypothetical protein
MIDRDKNTKFIRENLLTLEDVKEIILDLTPLNIVKGRKKIKEDIKAIF